MITSEPSKMPLERQVGEQRESIDGSLLFRCVRVCFHLCLLMLPKSTASKLRRLVATEGFQLWAEHNFLLYSKLLDNLINGSEGLMTVLGTKVAELADIQAFRLIAKTGVRSDECLEAGFLPVQVHFYSPIPDLKDLESREVWEQVSELPGVDFRPEAQRELLLSLGREYGAECGWSPDPGEDPREFYTENNSFSFGCAASTHVILRHFKPQRLIEVGSGFSSLVMSAALLKNQQDSGVTAQYTIVDPYPGEVVQGLPGVSEVVAERVELLPVEFFAQLQSRDILFIDSGHCVRIGGDVNYLFLEVLPRLAPGVVVHVHDIPMPYEYTKALATTPSFRMFWTESYLLQAFLCFNNKFEVLLAVSYLMFEQKDAFKQAFPHYDPQVHYNISGSFWIRRKTEQGEEA